MKHWEWLESSYNFCNLKCSGFGEKVAQVLGIAYGGLYHMSAKLEKVDWSDERYIEIKEGYTRLSTFDGCMLTDLVLLCHDACIRLEISPHTFNTLKLSFHNRTCREGGISKRHPTIEYAIERVRKYGGPKFVEEEGE